MTSLDHQGLTLAEAGSHLVFIIYLPVKVADRLPPFINGVAVISPPFSVLLDELDLLASNNLLVQAEA